MSNQANGRLSGKVAIVTGAARGSGLSIARLFAAEGARVVLADVLDDQCSAAASEIGDTARAVHCDVTSESDWAQAVATTIATFDRVDVLVNNAAVLLLASIADTTLAQYQRVSAVNELGVFLGIRSVIEPMRAVGGGSIVNISSIDGHFVTPGTAAYAASKFAVRGLAKTAALELGRFGIRVNCVCPAAGNPTMVMEALPADFTMTRGGSDRHRAPLRGSGQMADVANAALFLASDDSAFVSGADLAVDGAMSVGMIIPGQPGT